MKVNEILKENDGEFDELGAATDDAASPHAQNNLEFGLSDLAAREIIEIEKDPATYYKNHGNPLAPQTAEKIAQILPTVDDQTLDLMSKSKIIQRSIERNYNPKNDSSFIDLSSLMEVLGKVQARMAKNNPPSEERIGYDASRPGYDDLAAYDAPPNRR